MTKPICDNCFYRWLYEGKAYCSLIEEEHGGNIKADRTECQLYLKKGTEPQWPCRVCGANTFSEAHSADYRGHICGNCEWNEKKAKDEQEAKENRRQNIKKVTEILGGDKETAEKIVDGLK